MHENYGKKEAFFAIVGSLNQKTHLLYHFSLVVIYDALLDEFGLFNLVRHCGDACRVPFWKFHGSAHVRVAIIKIATVRVDISLAN